MNSAFKFLSSLRLTVFLLGYSVLLIFLGSIAQQDEGLWDAQVRWFQHWWIIRQVGDAWWIPPVLPAGHTIGTLLTINLLAAHIKRFTWSFQKFGIQLTHFGIIVMLVGQLVTDERKVESFMSFKEGQTKSYSESHRDTELIFQHDAGASSDEVISYPQAALEDKGTLHHPKLPFAVHVLDYGLNGDILSISKLDPTVKRLQSAMATLDGKFASADGLAAIAQTDSDNPMRSLVWRKALAAVGEKGEDIPAMAAKVAQDKPRADQLRDLLKESFRQQMLEAWDNAGDEMALVAEKYRQGKLADIAGIKPIATQGFGTDLYVVPRPVITDDNKGRNLPWSVVEIISAENGSVLGRWLFSAIIAKPQEFTVGGQPWRATMRLERYYLPFSLKLVRARTEVYQGTTQAREFASEVRLNNPATKEDRPVNISMNFPLRYGGRTFYQNTMSQPTGGAGVAALLEAFYGDSKEKFRDREENAAGRESGLQVVENPSMFTPYLGCSLVGFGLLWQFLLHLSAFLAKRVGLPPPSFGVLHPLLPLLAILIIVPDGFLLAAAFRVFSSGGTTLFIFTILAVTTLIRFVIAWQVWKGRYHIFAMVFLLVVSNLMLVFAIKYGDEYGHLLWPIVGCQLGAFIGLAYIFMTRPESPTLASASA